jgi:hypothetical protein
MKKIVLLLLTFNLLLFANVAKIVAMNGEATVLRDNNTITLAVGNELLKDDVIQTKNNTKIQIIFKDETIVTIGKNSEFKINDYIFDEANQQYNANLGLVQGTFRTITGKIGKVAPEKFKLNSKSSSIGIRGTQILSNVQIQGDTIFCTEGEIEIVSQLTGETITLQAGQFVQIREGEPAVVQEFDAQTINTTDTNTKFLNDEEKEEALENFGVTINQVDPLQPIENEEDSFIEIVNINKLHATLNDTSTYDKIEDSEQDNSSSPTKGFVAIELGRGLGTIADDIIFKINENNYKLELKMDDFITNYNEDGSYLGNLSATSFSNEVHGDSTVFNEGTYSSHTDSDSMFDLNDDIQWGTWNADFGSVEVNGYWLYGNVTSVNEVQNLISAGTTATFQGYALGMGPEIELTPSNTSVNFNIDFGAKSLTGTFTVPGGYQNPDVTLTVSGTLNSSGFTFNGTNDTTGSGNGSFYGSNANSVGGNFNLENNWTYSGVFKAKKQ